MLVQPKKFPRQPFNSIPRDGIADFFADGNSQSCPARWRGRDNRDKELAVKSFTGIDSI